MTSSIAGMLGETGAKAVQAMLAEASRPREGLLATILGLGLLIFAAIGVVDQLKDALNIVWEVKDQSAGGLWSSFEATSFRSQRSSHLAFSCWSRC